MTDSLVSMLGASSKKPMTTCTILVMACLSWPCFFDSSCACSFRSDQSPDSLHIVTMEMSSRDVDGRSDDCLVCFSSARSFSTAACTSLCGPRQFSRQPLVSSNHLCELLCVRNDLVDLLRVVLVSLEKPVRHGGKMICAVQVRAVIKSLFSGMFRIRTKIDKCCRVVIK